MDITKPFDTQVFQNLAENEKDYHVRENKNLGLRNELESDQKSQKNVDFLVLDRLYYLHYQGKNKKIQRVTLKREVYVWSKVTS